MCVLCGEAPAPVHWADRGADRRRQRRDRLRRVQLAKQVLAAKGLRVADWEGRRYVVSDRKGRSQIVRDLGDLWPAAEELAGECLDPLDEQLLSHLAARRR